MARKIFNAGMMQARGMFWQDRFDFQPSVRFPSPALHGYRADLGPVRERPTRMPDRPPTPGRMTTITRTRRHARVAWASACAFLSDWAVMAVPTRGDKHAEPSDYVTMARRVKLIGQHLQFLGVVLMLEEGRTWDEVAAACRLPDAETAKAIYAEAYTAWASGDTQPWASGMRDVIPASAYGDPDAEAARLDEWYIDRSRGDGSLVPGLRPVTDGLY